jgi:hypothetical protein
LSFPRPRLLSRPPGSLRVDPRQISPSALLWWAPPLYALAVAVYRLPPETESLLPDAQQYLALAADLDLARWVDGDTREPLWPLLNALPIEIFGESPTVLRLSSAVMFACLVLATQYLAREAVGRALAIAVGAVLAASEWLLLQAVSGLREETAALGAVLVCLLAIRLRPGWRGPVLLGALAGLTAMMRWDTVILTLPVIAGAFLQRRVPWARVAMSAAAFALIVVPFCVGNERKFDDPLYHSNIHAEFFRNLEFGGRPGLPTKAEIARDAFAGPPESWPHYLFARHSLGWVADHTVKGTGNTALANWAFTVLGPAQAPPTLTVPTTSLIAQETTFVPWLLAFATGAGWIVLLTRRTWPIAAMLLLALLQHAPIQHLMDPRLGLAAVPFMTISVAALLRYLWTTALDRIAARAQAARGGG